mgnify:CR=1 FL=1
MIDAAHDDLCHAADPCVFRDLHRRSRPVHHGNLRPLLLRQVQIAAQLLYIPCGKEILQDLFGLAFPTDFSHPKKPLHIPMLGMPLLCAASSTRTVGIWSISTLPELNAAVFVFLIQQDLPSVQQGQCIRSYMRLHIAHHQISALFLRLMRRLRQGIRFAHAGRIAKKDF